MDASVLLVPLAVAIIPGFAQAPSVFPQPDLSENPARLGF